MITGYDRPVRNFIAGLNATGHVTHTRHTKTSVTIHHNGGRLSLEGILRVWQTRPASAHFQVDGVGALGQYVETPEYAWATGSTVGNQSSISIEMANSTLDPTWGVAEATWRSAARLTGWLFATGKVAGSPRPSKENVFQHKRWRSTLCAGPHMDKVWDDFIKAAQASYDYFKKATAPAPAPPRPSVPVAPARKTNQQIANEVIAGKWGVGEDRRARLRRAGYNADVIQQLVNRTLAARTQPPRLKSVSTIVSEVIAGKWGNGDTRRARLRAAGYNPDVIQRAVNARLG